MSRWNLIKSYSLWEWLLSIVATSRNLFQNWIQKLQLYTSSFGALIISNWQAPTQRELPGLLLRIWLSQFPHWNWHKQCLSLRGVSALRQVLERQAIQVLHLLPCCGSLKLSRNTLDLVITNEEHRINEILYQPGLGLSHHVCLQFRYLCYVEKCNRPTPRFNMYKADLNQLNSLLNSVE